MNLKISNAIIEACNYIKSEGIDIKRGDAIFEESGGKIVSCHPLFALLVHKNIIDISSLNFSDLDSLSKMKFMSLVCKELDVDTFWFRRFVLGFGRNFQVLFYKDDKDQDPILDDVSLFGIQLMDLI